MYDENEFICFANNATLPLEISQTNFLENSGQILDISLDQQIGSMIIMGFEGKTENDQIVEQTISYLKQGLLGGIVLYKYNIESPNQLKSLTKALHIAAPSSFIAVDQEGGRVQRLSSDKGFHGFPSAFEIATKYTIDQAAQIYDSLAKELYENGINLNLAPVVDINNKERPCNVIGGLNRSFGEEVKTIVNYAERFIDAHHKYNIATALKHFPGHGLAIGDTHKGMVDVTDTVQDKELEPFYRLIADKKTDMIMTAHVLNKHFDTTYPTTLSPITMHKLLRDKGYDGIIITDDLLMGAIIKEYGFADSIILSINAGSDLLLISNNILACKDIAGCKPDYNPQTILNIVKEAIHQGKISLHTIEAAYNRIISLKKRLNHSYTESN
ncbi:glycoside hydrolase family protein [Rickettsiales bacterium Ac37b]|nr:glycoside hydrolase family protein [Rickettsiales bacterium Ac37b]